MGEGPCRRPMDLLLCEKRLHRRGSRNGHSWLGDENKVLNPGGVGYQRMLLGCGRQDHEWWGSGYFLPRAARPCPHGPGGWRGNLSRTLDLYIGPVNSSIANCSTIFSFVLKKSESLDDGFLGQVQFRIVHRLGDMRWFFQRDSTGVGDRARLGLEADGNGLGYTAA